MEKTTIPYSMYTIADELSASIKELSFSALAIYKETQEFTQIPIWLHGGLAFEYVIDKNYLLHNNSERSHDCDVIICTDSMPPDQKQKCIDKALASMCEILKTADKRVIYYHLINYNNKLIEKGNSKYKLSTNEIIYYNEGTGSFLPTYRQSRISGIRVDSVGFKVINKNKFGMEFDIIECMPRDVRLPPQEISTLAIIPMVSFLHVYYDIEALSQMLDYSKLEKVEMRYIALHEQYNQVDKTRCDDLIFPLFPRIVKLTSASTDIFPLTEDSVKALTMTKSLHSKQLREIMDQYRKAINMYGEEYSTELNNALVFKKIFDQDLSFEMEELDTGLTTIFKSVNVNDIVNNSINYSCIKFYTIRYTKINIDNTGNYCSDLAINTEFEIPTYLSTSRKIFPTQLSFTGATDNCIILFEWTGQDLIEQAGIFIEDVASHQDELEFLVNKNTKFKLVEKSYINVQTDNGKLLQKLVLNFKRISTPNITNIPASIPIPPIKSKSSKARTYTSYDDDELPPYDDSDDSDGKEYFTNSLNSYILKEEFVTDACVEKIRQMSKYQFLLFTDCPLKCTSITLNKLPSCKEVTETITNHTKSLPIYEVPTYVLQNNTLHIYTMHIKSILLQMLPFLDKEMILLLCKTNEELAALQLNLNEQQPNKSEEIYKDSKDENYFKDFEIYRIITNTIKEKVKIIPNREAFTNNNSLILILIVLVLIIFLIYNYAINDSNSIIIY